MIQLQRPLLVFAIIGCALALISACSDSNKPSSTNTPKFIVPKIDPADPEFKKQVQAELEERRREEKIVEQAPWFGTTGLADDVERELPRYLRREFGHRLSQSDSIKARDLNYLGRFIERNETVHYWKINYGSPEEKFAYVIQAADGRTMTGWGNRKPAR